MVARERAKECDEVGEALLLVAWQKKGAPRRAPPPEHIQAPVIALSSTFSWVLLPHNNPIHD